jgi:nicotinate-nucleotide adenylyltransferase
MTLDLDLPSILQNTQNRLSPKRFTHVLGVAQTAIKWAPVFELDPQWAYLAGILHDWARELSPQVLLTEAKRFNIPIEAKAERHPMPFLHTLVGARQVQERFNINNKSVLQAIENHTLGKAQMDDLSQLIYICDVIEPNRPPGPHINLLQQALRDKGLVYTTYLALEQGIDYLKLKNLDVDSQTQAAYDDFKIRAEGL